MARFLIEQLGVDPHAHCEPPSHFNGQLRREDGSTQSAFTLSTLEQKAPNGQRNQLPGQSELFTLIARLDAKRVAAAEPAVMALVEVPVGPYTITVAVKVKGEHGPDRQRVEQVLANALMNQTPGKELLHRSKQMTVLIGMLGGNFGFEGKQRLDWVVAWAGERKAPCCNTLAVFHYNNYIAQLARQRGRLRDAEAAFEQMQTAGVKPNVVEYSSLINACGKGGQWRTEEEAVASEAFKQMEAVGLKPGVVTYNCLISAFSPGEQWKKAEEAFRKMRAAGSTLDFITYSALISAYGKGKQWKAMEAVIELAAGATHNLITHKSLISAFDKGDHRNGGG